jgi:hypothetical protein
MEKRKTCRTFACYSNSFLLRPLPTDQRCSAGSVAMTNNLHGVAASCKGIAGQSDSSSRAVRRTISSFFLSPDAYHVLK